MLYWLDARFVFAAFCFVNFVKCDLPVSCMYEDIRGEWTFYVGEGGHNNTINCSQMSLDSYKTTLRVNLEYFSNVTDEFGNRGFWTMVHKEGFEVVVHGRKFFAFYNFTTVGEQTISYCDQTLPGWTHDVLGHNWACYCGRKTKPLAPKNTDSTNLQNKWQECEYTMVRTDRQFIANINSVQSSWKATEYPEYDCTTVKQFAKRFGGNSLQRRIPKPSTPTGKILKNVAEIPDEWDWRNVSATNYVSPARDQGHCGSCYAFASTAMNEARLRIASNNTIQLTFSPQDIVDCSVYSQGCDGGFNYLIAGKYAEDFGLVEESCNPYTGQQADKCTTPTSCTRHYSTSYEYIGGYYGACNEYLMMLELYKGGPIAVGFNPSIDFVQYRSGIYHDTGLRSRFNPFYSISHAVIIVGYGASKETGEKYWIYKNSWGDSWGENGYGLIRRGTNEGGIESIAIKADPIF